MEAATTSRSAGTWKQKHTAFRRTVGLPDEVIAWTGTMRGVRAQREKDIIHTVAALREKSGLSVSDVVIDSTQSLSRKAFGVGFPTLTTSSRLFHCGMDRLLLGKEHFIVQGFRTNLNVSGLSEIALRGLAGECIPPPLSAFVTLPLILCLDDGLWEVSP